MQLISLANACLVALLKLFKPSVAADNVISPNVADREREEHRNTGTQEVAEKTVHIFNEICVQSSVLWLCQFSEQFICQS